MWDLPGPGIQLMSPALAGGFSGFPTMQRHKKRGFDPMSSIPRGQEDPLKKEMATHSTILAWEIPWTEESGGLHSA